MKTESSIILRDRVPADHRGVSRALAATRAFAEKANIPQAARARLMLVTEELLLNVVTHGRSPAGSRIEFEYAVTKDRIEMRVLDSGAPFDPRADIPTSSRRDAVLQSVEGGAGWPMILQWCDIIAYERTGGCNSLALSLSLSTPA